MLPSLLRSLRAFPPLHAVRVFVPLAALCMLLTVGDFSFSATHIIRQGRCTLVTTVWNIVMYRVSARNYLFFSDLVLFCVSDASLPDPRIELLSVSVQYERAVSGRGQNGRHVSRLGLQLAAFFLL